ncbi:MAG: hypothetical protein ACT4PZ_11220 [Panacagrimonas sp.]
MPESSLQHQRDSIVQLRRALHAQRGLVIQAWPSTELLAVLQDHLGEISADGGHVVVLDGGEATSRNEASGSLGGLLLNRVFRDTVQFTCGNGLSCSLGFLTNELAKPESSAWMDRLRLVVVPVGEQVFASPDEWELLALSLRDRTRERSIPYPQFVVVLGPRRSPESAIRDTLPIYNEDGTRQLAWAEVSLSGGEPQQAWWTVWSTESPFEYVANLSTHNRDHYCGIEPVLAHFAGLWRLEHSHVIPHEAVSTVDQRQAIQKDSPQVLYQDVDHSDWINLHKRSRFVGAVSLRDSCGNPWRSLQAVAAAGGQDIVINIATTPTLLLGYLLANAKFFAHQPLEPLSPKMANEVPFDIAVQLVRRIRTAGRLRLEAVSSTLVQAGSDVGSVGHGLHTLRELFSRQLGDSVADSIEVSSSSQWNSARSRFERASFISLGKHNLSSTRIGWLNYFDVRDSAGTVYRRLRAEHVLQTCLPGQIYAIAGKAFLVERISWTDRCVFVSHDDSRGEPMYRPALNVASEIPVAQWTQINRELPQVQIDEVRVDVRFYRTDFSVRTSGYVESSGHWATAPVWKQLNESPVRQYRLGRVAKLRLLKGDGETSLLSPRAAVALALWLNESAVTLFPETARYFLAVADVADEYRPPAAPLRHIVPRLTGACRSLDDSVLVFEDSHSDLGLARSFVDNMSFLLDLCYDYLGWFLDENSAEGRIGTAVCLENEFLPAKPFLAFGASASDEAVGIVELRDALRQLEPWFGRGSFKARRTQAQTAAVSLSLIEDAGPINHQNCDFCAKQVEHGEMQVMPDDGRVRCTACAAHGVDSLDQLKTLYGIARRFLVETLAVGFVDKLDVILVSQADLAQRIGERFIPTSGYDPRAVGLAIPRSRSIFDDKRHEVLIESGFSPEVTTATLVHELTHVWQFMYLDHDRMHREYGKLLIEGHALWAEAEFLNCQAATPSPGLAAERLKEAFETAEQRKSSDDEYGQGYRLLCERMVGQSRGSKGGAFEWLRETFPQ